MTTPFSTQYYPDPRPSAGGELTAGSVDSSHIVNGSIVTADIADGAITEGKFHPELQTNLLTLSSNVFNLMHPGWYGTFTIKNYQHSDASITFSVEARTYNPVTDSVDSYELLPSTTLAHNQQATITLPIHERLVNQDTLLNILYTLSNGNIDSTDEIGVSIENDNQGVYELQVLSAYIHNQNIEFEVTIVV